MTNVITSAICASEFASLHSALEDWQNDNSEELMVYRSGFRVKDLSLQLKQSIERFLNATANHGKRVDPDARDTLLAIDDFSNVYFRFKDTNDESSMDGSMTNLTDLWRQFGSLIAHFKVRPFFPRPQSIQSLVAQGVSHAQIANIYGDGWMRENGSPNSTKIMEEAANPGTHYNRETWVHPGQINRQKIIDAEWRSRGVNRAAIFDLSETEDAAVSSKTSLEPKKWNPPSLAEMVRLRAPASQIANVHGVSVDEATQMLLDADAGQPKSNLLPSVDDRGNK